MNKYEEQHILAKVLNKEWSNLNNSTYKSEAITLKYYLLAGHFKLVAHQIQLSFLAVVVHSLVFTLVYWIWITLFGLLVYWLDCRYSSQL